MSEFGQLRDLTDPAQLVEECKSLQEAAAQQSEASRMSSPMAGHPNPSWFFGRIAATLQAAASQIEKHIPKPAPPKPAEPVSPPPAPQPQPAAAATEPAGQKKK